MTVWGEVGWTSAGSSVGLFREPYGLEIDGVDSYGGTHAHTLEQ